MHIHCHDLIVTDRRRGLPMSLSRFPRSGLR
jgi:hypothetical protein